MTTFGVEEEFLLVDPSTGRTVPAAPEVLKAVAETDTVVHTELQQTQVEAVTAPCSTLGELAGQLRQGRDRLAAAARGCGVWVVPSGTPPNGGPTMTSEGARFAGIAERYGEVVRDYQACGCHVHVGAPDLETAVAVCNHLRRWLPMLLALSANSPFHHGRDTGYASWRMIEQSRFPGAGVPPRFRDAADYTASLDRLVDSGVLEDANMTFWLVRPSHTWPTVEFRVADTAVDVPAALLQAALSRALVAAALADLARGREAPVLDDQVLAAAVWTAARYGLDGPGVHPVRACRVPVAELLDELIMKVVPVLDDDLAAVLDLCTQVLRDGTGSERQRAASDAVRYLAIGVSGAD